MSVPSLPPFCRRKVRVLVVFLLVMAIVLAACDLGQNKADDKVFRIGVLSGADIFNTTIDGFKAGLAEIDFVEGETIEYDIQYADGDAQTMRAISEQFVADKVDLLFTTTNNAALAARTAVEGTDIPVVFTFVIGPVETGVVDSLAEPGGNITGVRNPLDLSIGKRVEFLLEIKPDVQALWIPYNPDYPTSEVILANLESAAPDLGVELVITPVSSPAEVLANLETLGETDPIPIDSVIIFPDLTVQLPESWEAILSFAQEHQIPILANAPSQVEQGAIFSYLASNEATGHQAARMAGQILKGIPAQNLPIETAELFLTVNIPAAEAMGLSFSISLLGRADTIIR